MYKAIYDYCNKQWNPTCKETSFRVKEHVKECQRKIIIKEEQKKNETMH